MTNELLDMFDDFEKESEEIKEEIKAIKEETKVIKEEPKAKEPIQDITIPKPKPKPKPIKKVEKIDKTQERLNQLDNKYENMLKSFSEIKELVLKGKAEGISNPLMDLITDFKDYWNYKTAREEIFRDHNLKALDIFETVKEKDKKRRKPLLWSIAAVKKQFPELCKDRDTFFYIQLLNRMERDGKKYAEFLIDFTIKRLMDFVNNNQNKLEDVK